MHSTAKSVDEARAFLENAKLAIKKIEEFRQKLESDGEFQKLWESDKDAALKEVGIDPDARKEFGTMLSDRQKGPECVTCITPLGNACHC
jgi:hypothetical protein